MRSITFLLAILFSLSIHAEPLKLDTERARISYSLGHQIGQSLKQEADALDPDIVKRGLEDGLAGSTPQMNAADMNQARAELQRRVIQARQAEATKLAEANLAAGRTFLEQNKNKSGVVALPDGLQYRVIKAGTGAKPRAEDTVTVNYRGTHLDGTEFDSSYRRNEPATFKLNGVIKGWTEGLQQMQEGGKYELFIPSELAYGESGAGGQIAPNETLVFEIELISVTPASRDQASQ
jgi:FKBP-type peptidyl-prolyl cis-trans isomerase FklB